MTLNRNIHYRSENISEFFSTNRIQWEQFYESEKNILDRLTYSAGSTVLDIGCACGGLGIVLKKKYGITAYTGVDINNNAIGLGVGLNPEAKLICGDFLEVSTKELGRDSFDYVFSLSCIDWNIEFNSMLDAAWNLLKEGGTLVVTLRLTLSPSVIDIKKSYQFINYSDKLEGEIAAYVVLNANELIQLLMKFAPSKISAFGYLGKPAATAVTPFQEICFTTLAVTKQRIRKKDPTIFALNLPDKIIESLEISP